MEPTLDPKRARRTGLALVGLLWLAAVGGIFAFRGTGPSRTVVVEHWANGHMAGDAVLLPAFAPQFNAASFRTSAGSLIQVEQRLVNSGVIKQELLSRIRTGVPINRALPNPTIVTPVAEHWLYDINQSMGRTVVDIANTKRLALTWIGIATFRDMAECLGWPGRALGYSDIIALSSDPRGWASKPCAQAEWGRKPLVAYTDPNSSSTGRSVLFTLFSIAAGKPPEALTESDAASPLVIDYLRSFQTSVSHYVPDSLLLSCEVFGGPRYGHFFPLGEDNLVKLYSGKVVATDPALEHLFPCRRATGAPIDHPMVMLYPAEGATAHTNPAAVVQADWVSAEQAEAAQRWIAFLQEDARQTVFMQEGFRPATSLPLQCPICGANGVDPAGPRVRIDPNQLAPAVSDQIVDAWGDVKNPGVLVFVVDSSLAMAGPKLEKTRDGVIGAIDAMYARNSVGLVTFAGGIREMIPPAPVSENRFAVTDALRRMQPAAGSAPFDAIREAATMAAQAPAPASAIRGVVVLMGGPANTGGLLNELVAMASPDGKIISRCSGFEGETQCLGETGQSVARGQVRGIRLADDPGSPILVYFIAVGMNDSDLDVGRIIAEATGSDFVGTTVDDLARVVGVFKGYF